jgi:hypothetical protein
MLKGWRFWRPAAATCAPLRARITLPVTQAPPDVLTIRTTLAKGRIEAMNYTIDVTMLSDADLVARERLALQAWIDASATSAAARARYRAAVQTRRDGSADHEALRTALADERAARSIHQALSDELARRRLSVAPALAAA